MYILHVQKKWAALSCLIDMNKLFEKKKKTSITFETCLVFMLYVDYGFNNNKHTFAKSIRICPCLCWLE